MMRVAIDLTALMPKTTGIDTYLTEMVRHLARLDRENPYTLFLNFADRHRFDGELGPNISIRAVCPRQRPARFLFQQCALPLASAISGYDVIHSPSFLMPWWRGRTRHLLTVHDMTFFSMPGLHNRLRRNLTFRKTVAMSIQRADLINVPSETTRRDLLHWIPGVPPERTRITPLGVSARFCPAPAAEVSINVRRLGLPQSYILYVGTIEPRKNIATLLDAYSRLISGGRIQEHLVLAGSPGWDCEETLRKVKSPELRSRVHLTGYVEHNELPWLYRGASMFVYPSLYEGFGLPPLEAMACGVPVISSSTASLNENLAGAAELVAPRDTAALAFTIERLALDYERRLRFAALGIERAARFRWETTARRILECYRELA
jgi:glycosyltransferase involved in cell wall biosynthesis